MDARIRILIADDHAIVREGLKLIVQTDPGMLAVGDVSTAQGAVDWLREHPVDVVVLDLSLPDRNGIEMISEIHAIAPNAKILVLSMQNEFEFAVPSLRAGAHGYLEKRAAPEAFLTAIHTLVEGRRYVSAELAQHLALDYKRSDVERPHDRLSPREFEVFLSIADGKPVRRIAADLKLSVKTVNNHRAHVLEKLGVSSTAELVRYAIRHRLAG